MTKKHLRTRDPRHWIGTRDPTWNQVTKKQQKKTNSTFQTKNMNLCWPNSKVGAHLSRQKKFFPVHSTWNFQHKRRKLALHNLKQKWKKQPFGWSSWNCPMTQPKLENANQTATQDKHSECKKNGNIQFWNIRCCAVSQPHNNLTCAKKRVGEKQKRTQHAQCLLALN